MNEMIRKIKQNSLLIKSKTFSDSDDICDIPDLTIQDIENAINKHKNDSQYPYTFKIGGKIGRGGFSDVYKLMYVDETGKANYSSMKKNYVVKVIDPIHSFLRTFDQYLQKTEDSSLGNLKKNPYFNSYLHQRNEALDRVTHLSRHEFDKHNFAKYYPELSFNMEIPVPMVTVIVMEEIMCSLEELEDSNDLDLKIRRMFKVGSEIGHALQTSEYPVDKSLRFNHRDIKPANIGVRFTGNGLDCHEYILIDCENGRVANNQTGTNTRILTQHFAAPELSKRIKPTDSCYRLADQYSFGATLAHILHPENWRKYKTELADYSYIAAVIDKCLQDNPDNRYASFQALIDSLNNAKQIYCNNNSESVAYKAEILKIKELYQKHIEVQNNKFRDARNRYERQLKAKDKELENIQNEYSKKLETASENLSKEKQKAEQLKLELSEAEKKLATVKKELENPDNSRELAKLRRTQEKLEANLDIANKNYRRVLALNDDATKSIRQLRSDIHSYKKVFDKKTAPAIKGRVSKMVITDNGKATAEIDYSYKKTDKGYTELRTVTFQNPSKGYKNTFSYDKNNKLISQILDDNALVEKTVYEYFDDGSYNKCVYVDGNLEKRSFFSKENQLSETYYGSSEITADYEFTYERSPFNDQPNAIYLKKDDGTHSSLIAMFTYKCWPDGSIRSKTLTVIRDNLMFPYKKATETYNINGLLESRTTYFTSETHAEKYYYDDNGRCVHTDKFSNDVLIENSSDVYVNGRLHERIRMYLSPDTHVVKYGFAYTDD